MTPAKKLMIVVIAKRINLIKDQYLKDPRVILGN